MSKLLCSHTMEYCTVFKMNDTLGHAGVWINISKITLSEDKKELEYEIQYNVLSKMTKKPHLKQNLYL